MERPPKTPKELERASRTQFTRRAALLLGGQVAVIGALGWRMYQLQVLESDAYQMLAEENRINHQPLAPVRGEIFDRSGVALAVNRNNYRLRLIREEIDDLETTIANLRRLIDLSDRDIDRALTRISRTRSFVPVLLTENMSWEEYARVNANAPALPGVAPEIGLTREYPSDYAVKLAHVLGYVAAVNDQDLRDDRTNDPSLRLPDARIGKNGVERGAESLLRGEPGVRRIEVNAAGREIREIERDEGRRGDDLSLTIDAGLQNYAMARLEGESAAAVVMDIENGDILALASAPAYDPNKFVFGISHRDWRALTNDEYDPLRNKAVAGGYPPGSTFKMLTALAALEHGEITPDETIDCTGSMRFGNRIFHCWKREGHGAMDLRDGIKKSCDIYFYEIARRIGINKLAELAMRFGIGERFPLEIPNVNAGVMPTTDWKRARLGEPWQGGETLIAGIGQGYVLSTPLQLAAMTARIANGRIKVRPRLIRALNGVPTPPHRAEALNVNQEHLDWIKDAMFAVSNEPGGTAYRSQIAAEGFQIAGKTGTSQVRRITMAERETGVRENEELPWRLRDHALFVAYAPADAPRYAIAVVVEHGGSGSRAAAPVARDIMLRALYGGEPPIEAYPDWAREEIEAQRAPQEDARLAPILRGFGDPAIPLDRG